MSTSLSFETTTEILGTFKIPPAPAVFMELHEMMQQDEPDIDEIAGSIQRDAGLAALVLKTVNSPFFGLRTQVSSIRQAVTLLGLLNIGNIVAGLALRRAMEESGGPTPDNYWDSPANVGMVAARLAKHFGGIAADEAYLLGLFHNVGMPLMMQRYPDYLVRVQDGIEGGGAVTEVEEALYDTNHAVIGYFVSRTWGLPEDVGQLILRLHDVTAVLAENGGATTPFGRLLAILKMAEHIDQRFWGRMDDPEWQGCEEVVLEYAGVSAADFEDLAEDMLELLHQHGG